MKNQENRNRRKNLRIQGLPETTQDEYLKDTMGKIFNPLIGRAITETLRI